MLEALAAWGLVASESGRFVSTSAVPRDDEALVPRHHARSLRMWARRLEERVRGFDVPPQAAPSQRLDLWLQALAVNARASAPAAVDACLSRLPGAERVLDLGGGHGDTDSNSHVAGWR